MYGRPRPRPRPRPAIQKGQKRKGGDGSMRCIMTNLLTEFILLYTNGVCYALRVRILDSMGVVDKGNFPAMYSQSLY